MTLAQLSALKAWHVANRHRSPLEYHTWDAMLTCWILGWMGIPAALVLWQPYGVIVCVALFFVPDRYVAWRLALHRRGRLRCEWSQVPASVAAGRPSRAP